MGKVIGEITVAFVDESGEKADRKFKLRRKKFTESSRILAMLRTAGTLSKNEAGDVVMLANSVDVEKYAAYQIELCRLSLSDDDGKPAFKWEDIDDWGGANIGAVCEALDAYFGPAKTSVDHSGNS